MARIAIPMIPRVVVPEILDSLAHDHPDAVAGRRDLRRVNVAMGNSRFILKQMRKIPAIADGGITEVGAGDGILAMRLAEAFPNARVTAVDFAPAPAEPMPENLEWRQMNLFDAMDVLPTGGVLVASLFLHHFENECLHWLGMRWLERYDALLIVEPDRRRFSHVLGWIARPFIHDVTRHDMHVSINAGFTKGEIPELLGVTDAGWRIEESCTIMGSRRIVAMRPGRQSSRT